MSGPDMASDEKNAERAKIRQEEFEASQSDWGLRNGEVQLSGKISLFKITRSTVKHTRFCV